MIFAVDVGNTNITCALFDGEKMVDSIRLMTQTPRTSDEFGMFMYEMILRQGAEGKIDGAIISSVVPQVMHALKGGIIKYLKVDPLIVGPGIKTGIKIDTPNPREIGADRIVDVVAAYTIYGGPTLVIDFGTATTYNLVHADGRFNVGITAPGIKISAKALWEDTAKLPEIEIAMPKSILANDTIWSMQAGLMYGQVGATEYIINQVKKETGYDDMKVISTGGMGRLIANETKLIDSYDIDLTMNGLRIIYDKNR